METKKSSIDLTGLAIGVIILGLVVSIGSIITYNVGKSQIANADTYQVANESISPTTTGTALSKTWVKNIDTVYNASNGVILTPANYSLSVNSDNGVGSVLNSTCKVAAATGNCVGWKVTYTVYNVSDPRFDIPNDAAIGLATYGDWFKVLVICGIAAGIIGMLYVLFGKQASDNPITGGY